MNGLLVWLPFPALFAFCGWLAWIVVHRWPL